MTYFINDGDSSHGKFEIRHRQNHYYVVIINENGTMSRADGMDMEAKDLSLEFDSERYIDGKIKEI